MKYRTVIEIVSDAENEGEAFDIAGEFLRGHLESGIEMKCRTKPLRSHLMLQLYKLSIFLIVISVLIGATAFGYFKNTPDQYRAIRSNNACPPPLRTSEIMLFREGWQEKGNQETLQYIKEK